MEKTERFLNRAFRINELISENMQELKKLRMQRDSLKSALDEKNGSSPSANASYVNLVEKIIAYENKIIEQNAVYLDTRIELRKLIGRVENVNYNLVLKKRYLQFMTFEAIAADMNYDVRTIYRIRDKAVAAFRKVNNNIAF